jgi:hypothetical protein
MFLSVDEATSWTWPQTILVLGLGTLAFAVLGAIAASVIELRKAKIAAAQEEQIRQLVRRYEQLAETTLDAQQRVAADMSELRSRTTSIEQILRTVE